MVVVGAVWGVGVGIVPWLATSSALLVVGGGSTILAIAREGAEIKDLLLEVFDLFFDMRCDGRWLLGRRKVSLSERRVILARELDESGPSVEREW